MKITKNNNTYFLYARKSTESEDRQVQSIEDQIKELKAIATRLNLTIIDTFIETKSAKKPHARPIYMEMMERIKKGEATGILSWKINRLTRNPVDTGDLIWLLQNGIISSIQTMEREYLPEDNVLLLSVEGGMATQYVLDLSKAVKRGIKSKLEKGEKPNLAPTGYLNDKDNKTIIEDPERFPLVRRMWDLMLTGCYTPPQILKIANSEWGFRTKRYKRIGGNELSRSGIYRIFTNLFYAGIIEHNLEQHLGKHTPMVSLEEYDRVQMLLGREGKPRPKNHVFPYTGFIRCGECGCLITAEVKTKLIKSTGEAKLYTYYHCTRKKKSYNCSQKSCVRSEALEDLIVQEIEKFTILPEFREWALEVINSKNEEEVKSRQSIYEQQNKALEEAQRQLDTLMKMRLRELISDEEFISEKANLNKKINDLKQTRDLTEYRAEQWVDLTEKTFNFVTHARQAFLNGNNQTKKEILMALGQNCQLKDGKLFIEANNWLQPIKEDYPSIQEDYLRLEPADMVVDKDQMEAFKSVRLRWLGRLDSNQE